MELRNLIDALVKVEPLRVRQWIMDADDEGFDWTRVAAPTDLTPSELAVAAGVVEVLAVRCGKQPPAWTASVPASPQPVWLLKFGATLPRTRKMCEEHGPAPLRRRNVFAPPEFLTAA